MDSIRTLRSNQEQNIITSEKTLDLVICKDNTPITTSVKVAEYFGKKHYHVVRDIENIIKECDSLEGVTKIGDSLNFVSTTYISTQNDGEYKMYEMDKDSFTLLAMGFTGAKALKFKIQYIAAFNAMEQHLKGEHPQSELPANDTYYVTTFHNPTVVMSIKKKDCSDNFQRFIDFGAGVMFPVQKDNSIQMSDHQYNKVMDIIGMELKTMVNYGFRNGVFGQKDVKIEDVASTLPALPSVDKFAQLESTQKMLQIELSAATSQIEEMKALKVAENAIRTKAEINNKKTASAMGKAGALTKKNKKLQQENLRLKRMLQDKSIFDKQ